MTSALLNDTESVSGTITAAEDFPTSAVGNNEEIHNAANNEEIRSVGNNEEIHDINTSGNNNDVYGVKTTTPNSTETNEESPP